MVVYSCTGTSHSFTVLQLTLIKTTLVVKVTNFLQLGQEAASIQLRSKPKFFKLLHSMIFVFGTCATSHAVRKAVSVHFLVDNRLMWLVQVEMLLINFWLVWVVSTGRSLALQVCLLHDLIVMGHAQLLVCGICGGDYYLASARVASTL